MRFTSPLVSGKLIKRYKRFLTDVELSSGETITVVCPNTGSMLGLNAPGNTVWFSRSESPTRKYTHTWELVEIPHVGLVGVNTGHPNRIVAEAIAKKQVAFLSGYPHMRAEVKYGQNSRIDLLLEGDGRPSCYVEIKNVHFFRTPGLAEFPDCVTARGRKHLMELADMVKLGFRAVMVYLIQNDSPSRFALADDKDSAYFHQFRSAQRAGVEALALTCNVSTDEINVKDSIPILET